MEEETEPNFENYNSQMRETILLEFFMCSAEGGGRLQYENDSSLTMEHGAMYMVLDEIDLNISSMVVEYTND